MHVLPRRADPRNNTAVLRTLDRFATLAGDGAVLLMTAGFGRSPVREAAYRLRAGHRDLDLKLSWQLFASLEDWGKGWQAGQTTFAAGVILSAAGDPVVERAVGRCIYDLARLGRPLLWGVVSDRVRWHARFTMHPNGWPPEEWLPDPANYARFRVARDGDEFRPQFEPILYSADPDFFISSAHRLRWLEDRHFDLVVGDG